MSLGAAGCGWENRADGGTCPHLIPAAGNRAFRCGKYEVELRLSPIAEPFRHVQCGDDAMKEIHEKFLLRKAAEAAAIRGNAQDEGQPEKGASHVE